MPLHGLPRPIDSFQDYVANRVALVVCNEEPGGPRSIAFGLLAVFLFTVCMVPIAAFYGFPLFLGYMHNELESGSTFLENLIIGLMILMTFAGGIVFLPFLCVSLSIVDGIGRGQSEIRSLDS